MIVYDKEQKQIVIPNGLGNVNIIINQGCDDNKPTPPQDGWGMTGYFNNWGESPDIPFKESGEWDGRPYKVIRNFEATGSEFKIRRNNAWTDSYTAGFNNIPQFAKLIKGDFNMSINDGVWDIYLFFGNDGEPNEMLVLNSGTDLSTIQYEYTLTISTDKENAIIDIDDSYEIMGYRYYGDVTVTMKYGCTYTINVYMEGYEDISDEITCYNDEERNYTLTKIEGGGCNLGDLVKEITENGNYVYYPSNDGLDGYKMADIRINVPQGGGCTLTSRTLTQNGTYRASDGYSIPVINFSQNGAFDSKLKASENATIEFYFAFKDERPDLISFYGSEDSDWQDTTFAARFYGGYIEVKIGSYVKNINVNEYSLVDGEAHKMKVGRNYGIEIDGQMVTTADEINNGITFTPSETRTIYIGAINSPGIEDNGLGLFWRPFNGFIGPVTIYGKRENGEEVTYNYEPGDFGRWGEYKVLQTGEILKNINTQEGATPLDHKTYNPNAVGYSEVTVNVPEYNLGALDWTLTSPYTEVKNASDDGYDGYSTVTIRPENIIAQEKENAINDFKNKMKEITITQNGTYSIEDQINVESLKYNGGYHTDTISTYDINRIEVTFKADTSESINGGTYPFILGGSLWGLSELPENRENNSCARAIQYGYGRIVGYWEGKHTGAVGTMDGEWLTIVLDENGMTVKYPTYEEHCDYTYDNGQVNGGGDIFPFIIGGQGSRGGADESGNRTSNLIANSQFRGLIKEIKINTNSMGAITYIPKDLGVWDRKVENTGEFLSALAPTEGEVTMNSKPEKKYPNGFKRVEVNVPDLNGSYDEGYAEGERVGYEKGQIKAASNARMLNVTENGIYKSKFTDLPLTVTGVYDDGTEFNSYAELSNKIFNTKIAATIDSRLEFWYKGDYKKNTNNNNVIIGSGNNNDKNSFQVRYNLFFNDRIIINIGDKSISITNWNDRDWHHLIISKAEGLWIDGEKKGDFSPTNTIDGEFFINGIGYKKDGKSSANGTFGMIKIDDVVIIPTEDGFLNTNTRRLLEVVNDGGYTFAGELYRTIDVNVVPQISIKEEGLNVWYNDLKRITDENAQINSDWDLALQGETIQNVFPGIAMTISGQAVAKPFFIDKVNGNSAATKIGKLVSSANGTPVSCAVVIIGAFDCKNIQTVDLEAFKYMTDLCFIDGMKGLGESFTSPQTIDFTYCTNLFIKANNKKYISNFAESLFNLSAGNKNSINTSTLKFKSAVQERSGNADAIALMQSKGWTVEFV